MNTDDYGNPILSSFPRKTIEPLLKLRGNQLVEAIIKKFHVSQVEKAEHRRSILPACLHWVYQDPTEKESRKKFWESPRGEFANYQSENLDKCVELLKTAVAPQEGDQVTAPTSVVQMLLSYQEDILKTRPESEEDFLESNWEKEAEEHPDNGKSGWWLVFGTRHNTHARASSAPEAIKKAHDANLVDPTWENPSAKYLGPELPDVF